MQIREKLFRLLPPRLQQLVSTIVGNHFMFDPRRVCQTERVSVDAIVTTDVWFNPSTCRQVTRVKHGVLYITRQGTAILQTRNAVGFRPNMFVVCGPEAGAFKGEL